jgi:periplasmic divalent cation tolerance protein
VDLHKEKVALIITSVDVEEKAVSLVNALIEKNLIACGSIIPGARSIYRWQGQIEDASELIVLLKTSSQLIPQIEHSFIKLHPYDTPEFIVLHPDTVSEKYNQWLMDSLSLK